ncbi:MAG: bifunctional folylpolyglutamate synthase/dihydrofolate synthase [Firmicutes bacterium]|nr:bifunctional folylpolyglutamate synthase/dihydrofolate synthase [Bacillota bacterium]
MQLKGLSAITYNAAIDYIYRSHSKIGLDGVKNVLQMLGNPQDKFAVIHVAGTNGKGSTCAFLSYILTNAGYKTGLFTSPHLAKYNERIKINNIPILDADFAKILTQITQIQPIMSFFENLTCMAYTYFAEQSVDIAIIETGIGGRLDSTNAVNSPILSVITAPGYDHTEILGETLAQLAFEDAGIIKNNCPVAVYPTSELATFSQIAAEKHAPLYYLENIAISDVTYKLDSTTFSVETPLFSYGALQIKLLGEHQIQNAIHAVLCTEILRKNKLNISETAMRQGLLNCEWAGRFEIVTSQTPQILLDGAHNEDGARVFKQALNLYFTKLTKRRIVLVVAISQKKDYTAILEHMLETADIAIFTCSSFKAIAAQQLADFAKTITNIPVFAEPNAVFALQKAKQLANTDGIVAIAGSLYLIGDIRKTIF